MTSDAPPPWNTVSVDELIAKEVLAIGDGYRAKNAELSDTGLPFARAKNVRNGFTFDDADVLSQQSVAKAGAKISATNDVVFTSKGTVGRFALVTPDTPRFVYSPQLCYWRVLDHRSLDPRFLYFWLHGDECRIQFYSRKSQTDMADYISLRDQKTLRISLPPIEEQIRISSILGALDDKIRCNQKIASLNEQVTTSLFQQQFLARPLRDNAGRDQCWRESTLGELAAPLRAPIGEDSDLPYVGLSEMPRGSMIIGDWLDGGTLRGRANRFSEGDLLLGKLRPYFRKVGVALLDGRASTEILVLRPRDDRYWGVVLGYISSQEFIDHCVSISRGTRMPRAEWKDAGTFPVLIPPPSVAAEHTHFVRTTYAAIRGLVMESRTLSALRDALLPRLISGDIRAPDTTSPDEAIEAVAAQVV